MIIKAVEWDNNDKPTRYVSSAVYTLVDGKRTLVSNGLVADTLEEIVSLVQHAECNFDFITVK